MPHPEFHEGSADDLFLPALSKLQPLPVAQTFTFADENGRSLQELTRLDTMVTVIDAANFLTHFRGSETLKERSVALGEEDERTLADLFINQVEFANLIVINKKDLVSVEERDELHAILHKLNPAAGIIEAERGRVPLGSVLNTRLFDLEKAQSSAGWIKVLSSAHTSETEEYGISSFVFRARRPFHPERFWYFPSYGMAGAFALERILLASNATRFRRRMVTGRRQRGISASGNMVGRRTQRPTAR